MRGEVHILVYCPIDTLQWGSTHSAMMEKSENNYANGQQKADKCKVCGKEGKGNAIKDHIEANHIKGIVIPCNLCDKTFRSRNALKLHTRSYHSKSL